MLARRLRNALAAALGVERAAGWRSPNFSAIATTLQFISCTAQLREAVRSRSLDLHVVVQSSQKCAPVETMKRLPYYYNYDDDYY